MEKVLTRKRLTREESRAQTRERLIESALAVFAKHGIESTSIEEVTEAAGYSRGAFYSNFESKDDLLCAVLDREIEREGREFEKIVAATVPPRELISRVREYYVTMGKDETSCAFWLGLQLYALKNQMIRPRVAELMRKKRENVIEQVRRVYAAIGHQPPGSAEIVSLGLIAVAQGLALTQMLDPTAISAELLPTSLETLFDQISGVGGLGG